MFKPNIVNKSQGIVSGSSYFVHIQMNIKAMDVTMRSVALPSNNTKGPNNKGDIWVNWREMGS